jgi:hypothetical protein
MWLVAVFVFSASVGSLEAYWRSLGFRPTVPDSMDLWYFWRQRVDRDNGKVFALIGTSRIRADISLDVLEHELGMPTAQLGIQGSNSPIGMLRDLAADRQFRGVVLCSLFIPYIDRSRWGDCDDFVTYRSQGFVRLADSVLSLGVHSLFAMLNEKLSLHSLVAPYHSWSESDCLLPEVPPAVFCLDRRVRMWPGGALRDPERAARLPRLHFLGRRIPKFDEMTDACDEVESLVRRIRGRGGNVIFIHLPSSGEQLSEEEKVFPRSQYWDRFAKRISAPCIYFQDYPSLRSYTCPDGVHLSEEDAVPFTKALAREIKRAGLCTATAGDKHR